MNLLNFRCYRVVHWRFGKFQLWVTETVEEWRKEVYFSFGPWCCLFTIPFTRKLK